MEKKLEIIQFTDPMCVWCWAIEPSLRKIEYLASDKVTLSYVMGVLTSDVRTIIGTDEHASLRFQQLKSFLKEHFLDASKRSGMPVETSHFQNIQEDDINSLPMNLGYKAMQLIDEDTANKFLRRMRESALTEGIILSNFDRLIQLADEFNVDSNVFRDYLLNGRSKEELSKDLNRVRNSKTNGFPTILLKYGDKEKYLYGFQDFVFFKRAIEEITDNEIQLIEKEATLSHIVDYLSQFKKVALKEIQIAFTLSQDKLNELIDQLLATGMYEKVAKGNGYFIQAKDILSCDPKTGTCNW